MRRNADWAVKILALILVLTASVAAEDTTTRDYLAIVGTPVFEDTTFQGFWFQIDAEMLMDPSVTGWFRGSSDTIPYYRDTARYYAKVDTVLCRRIAGLKVWEEPFGDTIWTIYECLDTVRPITWLPKIQVWLDSTRYKTLMEWLDE